MLAFVVFVSVFFSTSELIDSEERIRNDLFCVGLENKTSTNQ